MYYRSSSSNYASGYFGAFTGEATGGSSYTITVTNCRFSGTRVNTTGTYGIGFPNAKGSTSATSGSGNSYS